MRDIKICVLGSGSSGNSIFISSGKTNILVDFGFSEKEIKKRLQKIDIKLSDINAILVTHEHSDHSRGLGKITEKIAGQIYINELTYQSIESQIECENIIKITNSDIFEIGDFLIKPFSIFHDASDPCGYSIFCNDKKITLATDLGIVNNTVLQNMADSNAVIIESNYDQKMLMDGNYPWHLKNRILGREGHLSNHDAGKMLQQVMHSGLEYVFLFHLSEENNTPQAAVNTVKTYIPCDTKPKILCSSQDDISGYFYL
ncbi:MAG: MBL fold metallo-hydrolase [bacterium]|nr:MBL fold metallo-hydrolase [bacterium]